MSKPAVLIADAFHPLLMSRLEQHGISFDYLPEIDRAGIRQALKEGYNALVIRSKTYVDEDLLQGAHQLKYILRGGAGMDNIDETAAAARGILCMNADGANADTVGEHALGMLLSLLHKITKSHAEIKQRHWDRDGNRGTELGGKTVGIVGYGNTGSAVARKMAGMNVRILAYDKYKKGFGNSLVEECDMQEIFKAADIVTFHIPLNSHTKFMVDSEYIHSFVRNIYLMNLSRGQIVKTADVVAALDSGKILGFCADVLEHEDPLRMGDSENEWFEKLLADDRVILTPHVAGWSEESYLRISEVLADKITGECALLLKE